MAIGTTALLVTALTATAVGTGVSAYNQYQAGKAQQALNNYNAQVNEQVAADTARDARIKANAQRAENERLKARQRALYAKAGVVLGTGTPLLTQVAQAGELEMAALEVETAGNVEAARLRTQAVLDRMAGKSASRAGTLGAAGTILQGIGQASSIGLAYKGGK